MEIYSKFVNAQTCKMNICTFLKITISEQINGKKLIKKKKNYLFAGWKWGLLVLQRPRVAILVTAIIVFFLFRFCKKKS